MSTKWTEAGKELATKLKGVEDEQAIKELCQTAIDEIRKAYPDTPNSRKTPLSSLRKVVAAEFPDTEKQLGSWQYFTDKGKGSVPRYQHLALKYLTLSDEEWDAMGDNARKDWKQKQAEPQTEQQLEVEAQQWSLDNMTLEQLQLDDETNAIALDAMTIMDISLTELIKRSIKVYAKTVVGKFKKADEDLATVSTEKLLSDKTFSTHPGRAEELTKRAISAIQKHNSEIATESNQRWFICQSSIYRLIGAKPASIGKVLENYRQLIDDHNGKYELNNYTNRRGRDRDIIQEIDIVSLVPDGLDLF